MKNGELKNKVFNDIRQSRLFSEAQADKNLEMALRNKNFSDCYRKIKQLKFNIAKKEFLNNPTSEDKILLKKEVTLLKEIAKKNNINLESLKPNYSCKKCNDTGLIDSDFCDCYYNRLNKEVINNLGISVDNSHTFDNANFNLFDKPNEIKKIYNLIKEWCDKLNTTKYKNIVISGDTGVGKTYLINCVCNQLIKKNVIINYYTAFMLNNLFLKYRTSFSENNNSLLEDILNCDVLIVDDLGAEPNLKNNEEYFYLLFNERMLKNKFTIVNTNLKLDDIRLRYGDRTFSRLTNKINSLPIRIENKDLRTKI